MAAQVGEEKDKTWSLAVTVSGQPTQVFRELRNGSADWNYLEWLGFVSVATRKTSFYLDNLEITNSNR